MYILVLLFPFLGFILSGALGKYFGREGSAILSTLGLFLTFLTGIFLFYEITICQSIVILKLYNWFLMDIYLIEIGLIFDTTSIIMILVISCISFFVHLYSTVYMGHDPYLSRFMSYLSLFTFFMLILVTSDNYFQIFLGWEGVGLCSYLLINFFFTRIAANKAALKAMIMNRISDVFFVLGILLIFLRFKTTDLLIVFNLLPYIWNENIIIFNFECNYINVITFFLFIGAIGKSAQIGFHTWLPVAMEGPTPVSALLHAATMVTAGVFLIIRSALFFEYSDNILNLLCIFGCITALFSGMVATFQYDIKRIIAYSTCSQLGYMFFSCGLSNYFVAFFHLFNHAFFKALLFLSAGALIHALFDEQDIRKMGNLCKILPFIYISMLIGSLAIIGFPFLSGFYSKDVILELVYSRIYINSMFIYIIALTAALFTTIYSCKLFFYVFFSNFNFSLSLLMYWKKNITEDLDLMFISLASLIVLSITSGYIFNDMFLGYGSLFWNNSILVFNYHYNFIDIEYIHPLIKNLPFILCMFIIININIFFLILNKQRYNKFKSNILYQIFNKISFFFYYALFFDRVYNEIYKQILTFTYLISTKYMDKGILELIGPFGIYKLFRNLYIQVQNFIAPLIFYYLFAFFFFLFLLLFFIIIIYLFNFNLFSQHLGLIIIINIILFFI